MLFCHSHLELQTALHTLENELHLDSTSEGSPNTLSNTPTRLNIKKNEKNVLFGRAPHPPLDSVIHVCWTSISISKRGDSINNFIVVSISRITLTCNCLKIWPLFRTYETVVNLTVRIFKTRINFVLLIATTISSSLTIHFPANIKDNFKLRVMDSSLWKKKKRLA